MSTPAHSAREPSGNLPRKPILRLHGLTLNDVPSHPDLADAQTSPPDLSTFLQYLYSEADLQESIKDEPNGSPLIAEVTSRGTVYPINVAKIVTKDGEGVPWIGRVSEHDDEVVSFEELEAVVIRGHEKNEMAYTPAIYDANVLVEWDLRGKEFRWEEGAGGLVSGGVTHVEMRITQMHHRMPGGVLKDRVFTVLVVSFSNTHPRSPSTVESKDMQLPIALSTFPANILSRSHTHHTPTAKSLTYRNDKPDATLEQKASIGKPVVEGIYASYERLGRRVEGERSWTEWLMRTASDAGGILPLWVQRLGVPGAISKDVPLAVEFVVQKRGEGA